jgi:lipopolysaccharide transport system ATP-binding protein
LSVGDVYFQHKCFDRIRQFRERGTTLLLVSHDKGALLNLCDRAILLNASHLVMQGGTEEVFDYYNAMLANEQDQTIKRVETSDGKVQTISGSGEASIDAMELLDENDAPLGVVRVGQTVMLRVSVAVRAPLPELVLGYMIKDRLGQVVFGTNSHHLRRVMRDLAPGTGLVYRIRFQANLGPGTYSIACALHTAEDHLAKNFEWRDAGVIFNVVNADKADFTGIAWLSQSLECHVQKALAGDNVAV